MIYLLRWLLLIGCFLAVGFCFGNWKTHRNPSPAASRENSPISLIEAYGGHPDDPTRPSSTKSMTDADIERLDSGAASMIVEACLPFAISHVTENSRWLFQIARLGWIANGDSRMIAALELAGSNGSGIAYAYLAAEADDPDQNRYASLARSTGFDHASEIGVVRKQRRAARAKEVSRRLHEVAAHPADFPAGSESNGRSDEELAELDESTLAGLLESGRALADLLEPRALFELGRVAFIVEENDLAAALLLEAGQKGLPIAYAWLATVSTDYAQSTQWFQSAEKAGFKSAAAWRTRHAETLFAAFHQPRIVRAFCESDLTTLRQDPLTALTYIVGFHKACSDFGIMFLTHNANVMVELDPTLSARALVAAAKQPANWKSVLEHLPTSLGEKLSNLQSSAVDVLSLSDQAKLDAYRLVISYSENPALLRSAYAGMRAFVPQITPPHEE